MVHNTPKPKVTGDPAPQWPHVAANSAAVDLQAAVFLHVCWALSLSHPPSLLEFWAQKVSISRRLLGCRAERGDKPDDFPNLSCVCAQKDLHMLKLQLPVGHEWKPSAASEGLQGWQMGQISQIEVQRSSKLLKPSICTGARIALFFVLWRVSLHLSRFFEIAQIKHQRKTAYKQHANLSPRRDKGQTMHDLSLGDAG